MKNQDLNEGFIRTAVDWVTAVRIIRMLVLPWDKQAVYKMGLVDINGNKLRVSETPEEKSEMTPLVIFTLKLKRIFDKIPFGSQMASLATAYAMLKEEAQAEGMEDTTHLDALFEAYIKDKGIVNVTEDAPVNVSGGITTPGEVVVPKSKKKWKTLDDEMIRRTSKITKE